MLTVNNPKTMDWENIPLLECAEGNCWDAYFTLRVFEVLQEKLKDTGVDKICEHIMSPAMTMFTEIELRGMLISEAKLDELDREIRAKKTDLEDSFYSYKQIKKTYDIGKDIIPILYSCTWDKEHKVWDQNKEFGFGLYPPDKTEKGNDPSTSADTLETILRQVQEELDSRNINETK